MRGTSKKKKEHFAGHPIYPKLELNSNRYNAFSSRVLAQNYNDGRLLNEYSKNATRVGI